MHGDERRRRLGVLVFVDVGHERDLLEEGRELLVLRDRGVVLGERPQLEHVRPALLTFVGAVAQVGGESGLSDDLVDEPRQLEPLGLGTKPLHEPAEAHERFLLALLDVGDLAGLGERLAETDLALAREGEERGPALVAEAPRRRVHDASERERVLRIADEP